MLKIALSMLVNDPRKYIGIVLALAFTSFMMAMQPASFIGALSSAGSIVDDIKGVDLWVVKPNVKSVGEAKPMQDALLFRIRGIEGVAAAYPLHKGSARIRLPDGEHMDSNLYGIDDSSLFGAPAALSAGRLTDLRRSGTVLVDAASAKADGRLAIAMKGSGVPLQISETLEINENPIEIVGLHQGVQSLDPMPTLYTAYSQVRRFGDQDLILTFIMVQLKPGARASDVSARIRYFTGLAAYTGAEFKSKSFNYLVWETGNFISFGIVTLIVFAIGASIAAQSFAAFSRDNLRHFGLLKALGASTGQLLSMIVSQALLVGLLGFGIGIGVMAAFGRWLRDGTGVGFAFELPPALILFSAASVHLVCLLAALVSIQRVLKLEPATVFRS
jgi:putative ABC transport system permease protein